MNRRSDTRPSVSVVMPFAGDAVAALQALATLRGLRTGPSDELILVDNGGGVAPATGITVLRATREQSPAHARNVGAEHASAEWILFLDADTRAPGDLLDAYFRDPIPENVGALAGEVLPAGGAQTLAARYGEARSFLNQRSHLEHPFLPRAVAANLLVRRSAFEQAGGFYEGVRAAEDTDFSWRLQRAGWRLELRPGAVVEHQYRTSLRELRSQWRGYAAGRAWLARRYQGFAPRPAVWRALMRIVSSPRGYRAGGGIAGRAAPAVSAGRLERGRFLAIDALLSAEELAGFALSNRPREGSRTPVDVVLVAERFPARGDPLVELASTLERARVEAVARPESLDHRLARHLDISYREDDGLAARAGSLLMVALRHPVRAARDVASGRLGEPSLTALAPAVRRLGRDRGARVLPLGGDGARATAERIARLAGRDIDDAHRDNGLAAVLAQHGRRG